MNIRKAEMNEIDTIHQIVQSTIDAVYPKYYPMEVVDFFKQHHIKDNIKKDLEKGTIYLLSEDNRCIGTGSIDDRYIGRVYVLPDYQGNGYGTAIMKYLEGVIAKNHSTSFLDASLPSFHLYQKLGYQPREYHRIQVDNDCILCYFVMDKELD